MMLGTSLVFCQVLWSKTTERYLTLKRGPKMPPREHLPNRQLWPAGLCMPQGWVPFYYILFKKVLLSMALVSSIEKVRDAGDQML